MSDSLCIKDGVYKKCDRKSEGNMVLDWYGCDKDK
jgi:hypothetical protein